MGLQPLLVRPGVLNPKWSPPPPAPMGPYRQVQQTAERDREQRATDCREQESFLRSRASGAASPGERKSIPKTGQLSESDVTGSVCEITLRLAPAAPEVLPGSAAIYILIRCERPIDF